MKIAKIKSSVYKRVLGIFGAAGFLVTFQACYGTPQNFVTVQGSVKDADTEEGISNLQVSVYSDQDSVTLQTDENGFFNQTIVAEGEVKVNILDVDAEENGTYSVFDTTLIDDNHNLDITLQKN